MTTDLQRLMGPTGVRPAAQVLGNAHPSSVSRWVGAGRLVRPLPGVLALPEAAGAWLGRARAAEQWSGGHLSGRSALALWDVVASPGALVHVAVGRRRNVAPVPGWLRAHRVEVAEWGVREGLRVTMPARSVVEAWGHAHVRGAGPRDVELARAAVMGAVRRRIVAVRELRREVSRRPRLPGRADLCGLLDLVEGGCQSEFEIWGLRHLLDVPGLPPVEQQIAVETRIGTVHLDGGWRRVLVAGTWREVRLGVELDGAAFHGAPDAREADLERDAATAAEGWLVLRIGHRRGHAEPDACRADVAAAFHSRLGVRAWQAA
jgi:hypothetical protein